MRRAKLVGAVCCLLVGILILLSMPLPAVAQNSVTGSFSVPLVITNFAVTYTVNPDGTINAVITWDTNGPATTQLGYDTVSRTYFNQYAHYSTLDTSLTSSHSVTLTNLPYSPNYYFMGSSIPGVGTLSSVVSPEKKIVIPQSGPQPLQSFDISNLYIYWAPRVTTTKCAPVPIPKCIPCGATTQCQSSTQRKGDDTFSIYGRLQLPAGKTVADLQTKAKVTITIADQSGNQTVLFTDIRFNGRPQNIMWLYKYNKRSPLVGVNMYITTMTVSWAPQKTIWAGWAGFYIGGVLQLPVDIGVNTKPSDVKISIELPYTTAAGGGSVKGEKTVTCKVNKLIDLWSYSKLLWPWPLIFPYDLTGKE